MHLPHRSAQHGFWLLVILLLFAFNGNAEGPRGPGALTPSLAANPATLVFGNVTVGGTASLFVTLTNSTSESITISQQQTSSVGFSLSGLALPLALAAGHSFTFTVTFSPSSAGVLSGRFAALNPSDEVLIEIPLSGWGVTSGQLTISPADMKFGNVPVGTGSSQAGTLKATGASVTVSAASSTNSEFSFTGLSLPLVIPAGHSVPYIVTFAPQIAGNAVADLSFQSNAANSPPPLFLSGAGTPSVRLSWEPSTSPIMGYNVYRGNRSGGPYHRLNSSLNPTTDYLDVTVSKDRTYYYVTTAVNTSGQESGYSNQVKAFIPQ